MDEILGALFAVLIGMMYLPQVTNAIATSRHTMTDVTTAQEQQQWATAVSNYASQHMTTLETEATAATPVTLSVATVQAANVGLPTNFSGTNPFNQTWTAQVLQPTSGMLQVLAFGSGGNVIKDQELGQIARAAAGQGGFIPTNNSKAYSGGPASAYGTLGAWKISTAGYSVGAGGSPATLMVFSNGTLSSNYLYRNAIPGQPQLNDMTTALGLNGNNINDVGTVTANNVVTAAGNGVQIGSSFYYGDTVNSAIRQNGGLFIQNLAGSAAADISQVGNINSSGQVTAAAANIAGGANIGGAVIIGGAMNVGGAVNIAGSTTMGANTEIFNPATQYIDTGGNLYLKPFTAAGVTVVGGGGGSGILEVTGVLDAIGQVNLGGGAANAAANAGCSPNGALANSGTGPLFCINGTWQSGGFTNYVTRTVAGTLGNNNRDGSATANCQANEHMLSGGVQCPSADGLAFVMHSFPEGNGWSAFCGDANGTLETPTVYALCAS